VKHNAVDKWTVDPGTEPAPPGFGGVRQELE